VGGHSGDDTRGLMRRSGKIGNDDDGRTQTLVSKLFKEQAAGISGKQTAGSQVMFQVPLLSSFPHVFVSCRGAHTHVGCGARVLIGSLRCVLTCWYLE